MPAPFDFMANKKKKGREEIKNEEISFWAWPFLFFLAFWVLGEYFSKFKPDISSLFTALSLGQYIPQSAGFIADISRSLIGGLFSFLGILGWGYLALKPLKLNEDRFAAFILSFAAGLLITAAFSALMGILGAIKKEYFVLFASAGCLISAADFFRERKGFVFPSESFGSFSVYWLFLFLTAFINLLQSISPETFYDTVIYHLAVPNYWRLEGRIKDMPYLIFSKMPFNHGLVYLYGLMTSGIYGAKMLNWFASVFTLLSFFAFFRKYFSQKTLFAAAAVFFSIFHYMNVSWYASNDVLLTFFILCSFYLSLRYSNENYAPYAALAGLAAGFAMGIKYTSAIFVLGICISVFSIRKESGFSAVKFFLIFSICALLPCAPWLLKNWLLYSNPFYPMLYKVFAKNPDAFDAALIDSFMREVKQFSFSLKDWLYHPVAVSAGKIANDEYFTPLFAIVLPLAVFSPKKNPALKFFWVYFLCSWILWSFSSNVVRYLMPAWFAASLLAAYYAFEAFHGMFSSLLKGIVFLSIFMSFYWSFLFFYMEGKWKVVLGLIKAQDYLSSSQPRYPWPSNAVYPYIENSKGKGKTLFLGDSKTLYFNSPFEASSVFDRNLLIELAYSSKDGREIYSKLKEAGINRIIFNIKETMRNNAAYGILYFDSSAMEKFNSFFENHMQEEYSADEFQGGNSVNRILVYKLEEKKSRPSPNYIYEVWLKSGRKI